jgi:hypothetical protein
MTRPKRISALLRLAYFTMKLFMGIDFDVKDKFLMEWLVKFKAICLMNRYFENQSKKLKNGIDVNN